MAIAIDEAQSMIDAARAGGVHLIVGHSRQLRCADPARARDRGSGEAGRVRMISALNFTDFLYRPRRPEELDTARPAAASSSARPPTRWTSCGCSAAGSRRACGRWPASGIRRAPTEGAYSALLAFADGAFASMTYSGYGHFDSDEFMGGIGETGFAKDGKPLRCSTPRAPKALGGEDEEAAAKAARNYGGANAVKAPDSAPWHEHFGLSWSRASAATCGPRRPR